MKFIQLQFSILVFLMPIHLFSQNVGVNTTGANPHASSMLDIVSSDKGLLIPRVALTGTASALPVATPATSLLVYNSATVSDVTPGYYYWGGAAWVRVLDSSINADHDWYEVGGTTAPNSINDDVFTQGNVGIGMNVPLAQLDVLSTSGIKGVNVVKSSGNAGKAQLFLDENRFAAGGQHAKHIQLANGATPNVEIGAIYNVGLLNYFYIDVDETDVGSIAYSGASFAINKDGYVGIGSTTPTSIFHVSTPPSSPDANIRIVSGNSNSDAVDITGNSGDVYIDHIVGATYTATSATVISKGATLKIDKAPTVGANVTVTDNMALWVAEGNVSFGGDLGIGTTSPTAPLDLGAIKLDKGNGDVSVGSDIFLGAQGLIASEHNLFINIDSDGNSTGDLYIGKGTETNAATKLLTILNTGNVGIGTAAPSEKLHVIGNILASGTITSSDRRYKKEIANIENASELLAKLNPVSYSFRIDEFAGQFDDKKHYGVIAQEIENVLPELVYTNKDGYKAVNYTDLIAILIKAFKEEKAENINLESKINEQLQLLIKLSEDFIELEKQITTLKKK